jgi:15-cis-phytoene synthase
MTDIFRTRARTFWYAAVFLPADRRAAVAGLYAFARGLDDLVDEPLSTRSRDDVLDELAAWRAWLDQPLRRTPPDARLASSVMPALAAFSVPPSYLQMLVDGVSSDLTRLEMRSWTELRTYCVQVASSVGLAMCHLLGAGADAAARDAAIELGIAMQLTNILRDVGADLAAGRVYLTSDDLDAHGYTRERLTSLSECLARRGSRAMDEDFRSLMRVQIERARGHYAHGLRGIDRLAPDCRLAILLAGRLYAAILDQIEAADYNVFTRRAATSRLTKLAEVVRSTFVLRLPSLAAAPRPLVRS